MNAFSDRQMPLFVIWEETEVVCDGLIIRQWCTWWNGSRQLLDIQVVFGG